MRIINNSIEDRELVRKYINGNEKAFEALLLRHKDKIYRFIYMKVRDNDLAQDLFQDTFIKVVNTLKAGTYNEEGKFLPWVMRISHNLVIDYFRKTNKTKLISESSSQYDNFNVFHTIKLNEENFSEIIIREEIESQIIELLEYLPNSQKKILKMRIFKDMSFKDIACSEDISINTALGRMRYALINLRKIIDKHNLVLHV